MVRDALQLLPVLDPGTRRHEIREEEARERWVRRGKREIRFAGKVSYLQSGKRAEEFLRESGTNSRIAPGG